MQPVDDLWRLVGIGLEGQPIDIGGVNPWNVEWTPTHGSITVSHPQYPQERHAFSTYEVAGATPPIVFAAGEFSNGAWGFFVPIPVPNGGRSGRRLEPPPLYRAFMLTVLALWGLSIVVPTLMGPHSYPPGDPRNEAIFWVIVGGTFLALIFLAIAVAIRLALHRPR
jgi:hypothetical protein